jgi:hypothetical protein
MRELPEPISEAVDSLDDRLIFDEPEAKRMES